MIEISFSFGMILITCLWLAVRAFVWFRQKRVDVKRELQLLLVYICLMVVARFTFYPFGKVDGKIQPLLLDPDLIFPFNTNFVPAVYLFDYPTVKEALINLIGNTAMFLPLGIVWPVVFKELNTHGKAIAAGVGVSFTIELLQLPFFSRVSDVDDLLLNSLGYLVGYGILLLVRLIKREKHKRLTGNPFQM